MAIPLGLRLPGDIGRIPIEDILGFARQIGLDVLDLPAQYAAAAAACREHGMGIGSIDGVAAGALVSTDEQVRERAVDALCAQIAAMGDAGLRTMFLCLVPQNNTQTIAASFACYKQSFPPIAAACEQAGVRIAFEGYPGPAPYFHTLGYTPEVWRAMFEAVPSPALGLCYDPSHLVRMGIDYLRVLEEFGQRIYHCHGKDTALLPEATYLYGNFPPALRRPARFSGGAWRYCVPGTGIVNWAAVAATLESAGYNGAVSIELEDGRYTGSLAAEQQGVRKALEHLVLHFH